MFGKGFSLTCVSISTEDVQVRGANVSRNFHLDQTSWPQSLHPSCSQMAKHLQVTTVSNPLSLKSALGESSAWYLVCQLKEWNLGMLSKVTAVLGQSRPGHDGICLPFPCRYVTQARINEEHKPDTRTRIIYFNVACLSVLNGGI